jgi:hypothetical protein
MTGNSSRATKRSASRYRRRYAERSRRPAGAARGATKKKEGAKPSDEEPRGKRTSKGGAISQIKRMIIYSAELRVQVDDVDESIVKAQKLAERLGGYLQSRSGGKLIVRVPAERFHEMIEKLDELGDLYGRKIWSQDVTRQYMDLKIRLKAALAVLERLESLLSKTKDVKEALAVEKEMARVVKKIERLKGQIRYLEQHVSLSTITIRFVTPTGRHRVRPPRPQRTPFRWVRKLGIHYLLTRR